MTMQAILDRARLPLNDAAKVRYTDADLLAYAQEGVRLIRRLRPDAFISSLSTDPADGLTVASAVPVSYVHYQALSDYVSARAQDRDDELTGEKAAQWLTLAVGGLS